MLTLLFPANIEGGRKKSQYKTAMLLGIEGDKFSENRFWKSASCLISSTHFAYKNNLVMRNSSTLA